MFGTKASALVLAQSQEMEEIMNLKPAVTIAISLIFIALMSTGIMLYALPWNYFIGAIHIWASLFFIIGTIWHFKNNLKSYAKNLQKKVGKRAMYASFSGLLIVAIGLVFGLPPFASVMNFSESLKKSGQPETLQYTLLDLVGDDSFPRMNLFIKAGSAYESEPQPAFMGFTYTSIPQMAVWMETLDGQYIDTLYVTGKIASSGFGENESGLKRRPEALPVWSHSRGVMEDDGLYAPVGNNADLDGISGATPKNDALISMTAPRMGQYRLMVEVNRSYDFNDYYSRDRFPNDPIYSGDGSSGQPSLIYTATVDSQSVGKYLLELTGHGHHSGANGEIYQDMTGITTAKDIVTFIVAEFER